MNFFFFFLLVCGRCYYLNLGMDKVLLKTNLEEFPLTNYVAIYNFIRLFIFVI